MNTDLIRRTIGVLIWLAAVQTTSGFYNPSTGRWLNRDPIEERGGVNESAFVSNAPLDAVDLLGKVARGGFMQMNCRRPCEDYKRMRFQENPSTMMPSGGIVCCGGVKFVCTWGADMETSELVKRIVKRCIGEHERVHLSSTVRCDDCRNAIYPPDFKSTVTKCEDEMAGTLAGKACFEAALLECGNDEACIERLRFWIAHEENQYKYFKWICDQTPK